MIAKLEEQAAYFAVNDEHIYTVLHQVANPLARVLLVGPFAAERHFSYHPWVRWARYLATRRIEVLRYDYRGIGESTGAFDDMTFENWREDFQLLARWLQDRLPSVPLILHGLEIGGIFAGTGFEAGIGDALLLWSAPANANQALRSSLTLWAGLEQIWESSENRTSAAGYIRQLEQGSSIEVQGYRWSSRLWKESFNCLLPNAMATENPCGEIYGKPVRIVRLSKAAAPLVMPHLMYHEVRDLSWLYSDTFEWLSSVLARWSIAHEDGNGHSTVNSD